MSASPDDMPGEDELMEMEKEGHVRDAIEAMLELLPEDVRKGLSNGEFSVNDADFLRAVVEHVAATPIQPSLAARIGKDIKLVQRKLRDIVRERHPDVSVTETIRKADVRVGRNDKCPCGSGKKYKHCCLRKR